MRNTIRFYYGFEDVNITKIRGKNYIKYKDKIYTFTEVVNPENIIEAYNITINYPEYEKIVLNKDRNIFTPYGNKIYILLEKKTHPLEFPPLRELPSNIKYLLDRTNWSLLWEKKIDYFEYQVSHIKGTYKTIDESVYYFIGMTESAISYINYNIDNSEKPKAICRRRMQAEEYYNPLNIVVDHRMRDIGEYLKMLFWTNNYNLSKIREVINRIEKTNDNYKLLYTRLLYPSYYFDAYEKVVNDKEDEEIIQKIINRIDEYERYINTIYNMLRANDKNLIKVEWI